MPILNAVLLGHHIPDVSLQQSVPAASLQQLQQYAIQNFLYQPEFQVMGGRSIRIEEIYGSMPNPPRHRAARAKLPREEIEPLPLPG